ncbi:MAG: hypothetical protein E7517_07875, partial [Ruminococcaceae bacterium]|nr:hypothetical protein [Oscillospiraceae bacterium]
MKLKKVLSILLVAVMLLSVIPFTASASTASYVKVTENLSDWSGDYLIVCEDTNKAFNGATSEVDSKDYNKIDVTISNGAIEVNETTDVAKVTIEKDGDDYYILTANGDYIGGKSGQNKVIKSDSGIANSITYSDGDVTIISDGCYLRYNKNSGANMFRYYKSDSQTPIQLYKLEAAPAADEVSETISLAYAPFYTISGTHYTVSADNLVGESALTINDMHPMTINARKGETITKVVLTYSTGDNKNTLFASAGTFDGDATFSNINAQQVTISSRENVNISGVTVYFEGNLNNPTVTLTGGANAKSSGGLSTQSYLPGAMDTVTYTALADATFPEFETYTLNGVTVERTSEKVVTVSGTPTANTAITVPDAESSSKIVTWNASLINDYIADKISKESSYSDTANGITLTNSEGEIAYFGNSYLETYGATLNFSTTEGKFTSIEIEANNIYDGGNWTKDENILKWNGTPSESVSLTGDVFIMGLSSITFVIKPNTYTVTWQNEDGTELETDTDVAAGTIPTYDSATPTKATDEKYMYFFSGWSPEVTAVTGDITYTAQFDKQVVGLYLLKGDVVDKDETIRFPLVTRGNEFSGHVLKVYLDGELVKSVEVQGASSIEPDRYYTTTQKCIVSQFSKGSTWPTVYNTIYLTSLHTVTWKNGDEVLDTTEVEEGTVPTFPGAAPTKAPDKYYTYSFSGWTPAPVAATEDATYTAAFTATAKTFTVFVKTLTGKTIFVHDVTGETTAAQIKDMLVQETGLPAAQQRLIFAGKEMANDKTLADYNVEKESIIHLSVKANNGSSLTLNDGVNLNVYLDADAYGLDADEAVVKVTYNHNADVSKTKAFSTDTIALTDATK